MKVRWSKQTTDALETVCRKHEQAKLVGDNSQSPVTQVQVFFLYINYDSLCSQINM